MSPRAEARSLRRAEDLLSRVLPALARLIDELPQGSTVFDLGAGFGRHTLYALKARHWVTAVERQAATFAKLAENVAALGPISHRSELLLADFESLAPSRDGGARLVILTGVLQHCRSRQELSRRLNCSGGMSAGAGAALYIEMLFGMRFDGNTPQDGRLEIGRQEFEALLREAMPKPEWALQVMAGPICRRQDFSSGTHSFLTPARRIESVAMEYLLTRRR